MFDFLFIIVLALLAFPIIAIIALVKVIGLRQLVIRLGLRIETLEHALAARGGAQQAAAVQPPSPAAPPAVAPAPAPAAAAIQPVPDTAAPGGPAAPSPQPSPSVPPPLPPQSPPPPPPPPQSRPEHIGFEERFGTRWLVWVGGVALALGGIFLVRYTIEQGLIGPGVRILLGGLLALALVAVGEWSRRNERLAGLPSLPSAHIPSILTAAGTTVAYATVYAAYSLYGFLPPAAAFVLLGVVAVLTLGAALLHGPALAGLGVVGAYLTPLLVSATAPNYWALYVYIAVVSAAAFALARFRLWRWLAITAVVLGALWTLPGADLNDSAALGAHVFNAVAGFGLAAVFLVCGLLYGPPAEPNKIDLLSTLALSIYLLVAAILVTASQHDPVALLAFIVLTVATVAIAWRTEAAAGAVPAAAILTMIVMADWAVPTIVSNLRAPSGPLAPVIPEPQRYDFGSHFAVAAGWAALFGGAGFWAQGRYSRALVPLLWAASGAFTPLAMLIALYHRIYGLDRSLPLAALALLLAAIFALATESLTRRETRPGLVAAAAIFATGALAALALALTFALEKGWLTIGLALMVPGAAWVAEKRPLPWLRWLAAILVAVVVARVVYEPRIAGSDLGTTPVFNWLLYGYGVPAIAFWVAGWLLRRRADDLPARMVDAGAILFTVLLAIFEIRHYVTGGDIYRPVSAITEAALDINAGLALTIGLERVRGRTGSIVHNIGALVIAALTLCVIVFDLFGVLDPDFTSQPVGGVFFNRILLGYGLPAVLSITLALIARTTRPMTYRVIAVIAAVLLALFYLTLEVRRLFHGPILAGPTGDFEQYCYSTVWLVYGIALLAFGFVLRSQPARLVALAVIALTIAKVFIYDTASISGIFRALSVIGLGVVLLGIGWVYQRVLYPRTRLAAPASPTS
jgi:uncharacterized membrane protein